jgi:tripartite ATP-independent transporter DctP family solute receptor
MSVTRRGLLIAGAAAAVSPLFAIRRARAAEFVMKCSVPSAPMHPLAVRLVEAAKRIGEQSNGRIDFQVYPSGQLGGDIDVLSQTRIGAVQFQCLGGTTAASQVPRAAINGIGFAFADYGKVWAAMDGDVGAAVRQDFDKAGFYALPKIFDNGFRQLTTSSKQVKNVADVKALKLRVPQAPIWVSLWRALGASPTTIDFSEVYSALQTKIVEGQENALALVESNKLYEVQKYCSLTNHQWDGWWLLAHKETWHKLPDDMRGILATNLDQAAKDEREDISRSTEDLRKQLTASGLTFNEPDRESFKSVLKKSPYYKEWRGKFGDQLWDALQKYCGELG